ncbi:MAG: hypothetical protein NG747_03565 [Candidatus Brocadia sp.]|nr:hypothetical protein [Candidatus Brocadia sp.]
MKNQKGCDIPAPREITEGHAGGGFFVHSFDTFWDGWEIFGEKPGSWERFV